MKTLMLLAALAQAQLPHHPQYPKPPETVHGVPYQGHADHASQLKDAGLDAEGVKSVMAAWNLLQSNYPGSLDMDKAFNNAVIGVGMDLVKGDPKQSALKGLLSVDLYSGYMTPKEYTDFKASQADNTFATYGLIIRWLGQDPGTVEAVFPGSSAETSGIRIGDEIMSVNGLTLEQLSEGQSFTFRAPKPGAKTVVKVRRYPESFERELTANVAVLPTVFSRMLTKKVGYVQISAFESTVSKDTEKAVKKLQKQGASQVIIDLRGNPGGLVSETIPTIELFMPQAAVIGYFKDRREEKKAVAQQDGPFASMPLAVLIDGDTASGAEAFALAVKDQERGKLIGSTTYGKGSMQGTFDFQGGSAMKFTIGKWYGPAHTNVDGIGVTPDIKVPLTKEQSRANRIRLARQLSEGVSFDDMDPVLQAAFSR